MIKDREELEKDAGRSVAMVEISAQIRGKLKDARNDATELDKMQKKEKESYMKKNKEVPEMEEVIERRYEN